jgi:hypothetical protein
MFKPEAVSRLRVGGHWYYCPVPGRCRDWIKLKNRAHSAIERAMLPELLPAA